MELQELHRKLPGHDRSRRREAIEYRLLVGLTYPFFFVAALANRVRPGRRYFSSPSGRRRGSVFMEAKALANSAIPHAFMGW